MNCEYCGGHMKQTHATGPHTHCDTCECVNEGFGQYLSEENNAKCHRTACKNPHQWLWNNATGAFYCNPCRVKITAFPENADLFEDRRPVKRAS